jgi:integrase
LHWPYNQIVRLLICTAARRDEVGGMKWSELNLDRKVWSIPGARRKRGIAHEVPLNDLATEILQSLPRFTSDHWVFPARSGSGHFWGWSKGKAKLDALSGVKGATIHDIRRSVATKLQGLGVQLQTVEEILGHVSGSRAGIVGTYQRYRFEPEKRAALELWSRYLTNLLDPTDADNIVQLHG